MATLQDIADQAHVSVGTVSRILNRDNTLSVSEATRDNVIKIAKDLGYTKKARKNKSIQIITHANKVKEYYDPYYRELNQALIDEIKKLNLTLHDVVYVEPDFSFDVLHKIDPNCVLIVVGRFTRESLEAMYKVNPKMTTIDMKDVPNYINSVSYDLYGMTQQLLEHCWSKGFKKISFFGGHITERDIINVKSVPNDDPREQSYIAWCKQHDLAPHIQLEGWTIESGMLAMKYLLEEKDIPDVVLTANDMLAIGAAQYIKHSDIKVPEQLQIIGINNDEMAETVSPSITSLSIPKETLAKEAMRLAYKHIKDNDNQAYHICVNMELIERESTRI
ncbi:substrate-binding domain-containing protein [Staphylococcus auricularis]|uniref:substrate-binding domain-containing protein n=1 Tax=Staphylococcus auricularis TaxID=29379 RepID=UPI000D19DFB1|nr:substrate-binding domain-containing protein [Staphylococcus auricularis]MCE5038958.1 substrate-binding domain-containing protein [Staphylococcus auricularis]PTH25479.1 hypothetical protein BU608_07475 [Staphylococcus auricularis]